MEAFAFFGLFNLLVYIGIFIFAIYVAVTIMKTSKQRNEFLKEIRDELRKHNNHKN
ncbi:hypothetical protein [Cytobacillus purgationiresistens]|uniref:Heme exporter protein D n=1 Tax=Cytobacillus purgationiresistens TaxID=863449 RepID=A0ABU0AH20_9BACI|nr:hypothetical protein [Cytobacillus purgationiresistens]MDQ0270548.1 heme exporter protein D [Cytobacillus purgationiresistens]